MDANGTNDCPDCGNWLTHDFRCVHCDSKCRCGSGEQKYALNDCQGIFCTYVCSKCEEENKKKYNPWVFEGYNQAFCNEYSGEQIEPEETW